MRESSQQRSFYDALFQRIATGDEGAFKELFEQLGSRLSSYLFRITKSAEEAQELTQDIFIKIWVDRESLAAIESPQHYIFTMAKNRAIDYLRRVSLDGRMRQELWESIRTSQETTEEHVVAGDSARLIDEAIYQLSAKKQLVFKLSRIEGLTHDQIAAQLNISKNTVKNHIVSSLKFIKDYLIQH